MVVIHSEPFCGLLATFRDALFILKSELVFCPIAAYLCGEDAVQDNQHRGESGYGPDCAQELVYPMPPSGMALRLPQMSGAVPTVKTVRRRPMARLPVASLRKGSVSESRLSGFTVISPPWQGPGEGYACSGGRQMAGRAQPQRSAWFEPESLGAGTGNAIAERAGFLDGIEEGRVPLRDSRITRPCLGRVRQSAGWFPGSGFLPKSGMETGRLVNDERIEGVDGHAARPNWSCPS